ncbi:MAG TPA: SDR family NAD(P)-dependent oxidoreductase, partial [Amycolatopsis sp.]|nr:SDR family NAD(P)-dependent oxidoreductase [Amycolatopsis sp.]
IDSIKRVEILSAVRRAVPNLPEVDPVELGKLRSLGEITDRLRGDRPNTVPTREEPVLEPDPGLEMLVLDVVAEKTGYPVEMLEGSMELEADLGIDSIKRVEILSAVRRAVPDLPEVDPVELGKLRSLGEIVDRLRTSGDVVDAPVESALARYAVRAVETPAPGFGLPGLWNGTIVVTDDGRGVARHVVTRFKAHGVDAKVHSGSFERAHGLIHLGGLKDVPDVDAALEIQRDVFATARTVAERSGVFVTVQDTGGDFGTGGRYPDRAWLGGIAGLTRTAAREWPGAAVKAIDCERGNRTSAAVADAIVRELLNGGTARDVGLRADGTRTTVEAVPAHAEPGHARITKESVIVATGGARGVTAEAIVELAERWQPKIVLLGRTPLAPEPEYLKGVTDEASLKRLVIQHAARPPLPAEVNVEVGRVRAAREIQATLDRIRATGAKVRYEAVDVRDHRKLGETLDNVRRQWGPITGIVHGAGVLADKCIAEKTDLQFERVFDTKVRGLRVLLEATESDPLDVLVMFSSISAHVGNPGQSDYAMANEVLNQVAHAQRAARPGLLVRTIAWGPWEGGMVGPSLAEHFRRQGVPLIPVRAGARAFTAELAGTSADTHVVITAGDTGPINGVASGQSKGEVQISQRSHPYLADHDIQGMPVVPLAMALEWFAGAGGELKDVRVLRKIDLKHYTAGGDRLTVLASDDHLELLGTGLTKHYQATAESGLPAPRQWTSPGNLRPVHADIYDGGVLFHGPQFQVIREILGISDQGAAAIVAGAREMGWPGTGWHTDPAAVDGGLQLALLWAEQVLGRASLPMGVAEVRTHQAGLSEGWTRCVVKAGDVRAESAECDIAFLAEDGSVRAELLGVSLIARPGGV